jgi:hypothetical protein
MMAGMKYRKLRITWTVACGIPCLLLTVVWMRSYWHMDTFDLKPPKCWVNACSLRGALTVILKREARTSWDAKSPWAVTSEKVSEDSNDWPTTLPPQRSVLGVATLAIPYAGGMDLKVVAMPMLYPAMLTVLAAAAAWIQWARRFSVRTLLLTVTLLGLVFGLAAYAAR